MKRKQLFILLWFAAISMVLASFSNNNPETYSALYTKELNAFQQQQSLLLETITKADLHTEQGMAQVKKQLAKTRVNMKTVDFWLRYIEPLAYKQVNSPLPVEWETEVFEKFEAPYKREGAGLTLATLYAEEEKVEKDSLLNFIRRSLAAGNVYTADSITGRMKTYHHFFLCNRLFLLNLAAIYTTGFECPDPSQVIPELRTMLTSVNAIYLSYNESFPATPLTDTYLQLYTQAIAFAHAQPDDNLQFDHFVFLRDYINPLFSMNQQLIKQYEVVSRSVVDYSLNRNATSIFSKTLYRGQNPKGVFLRVNDPEELEQIEQLGKMLFYDPVLSGNNMRSCASCHKPTEYFADTTRTTSLQYNQSDFLPRNSPSLINAQYNHLIMADGKHISLQHQTKAVINNPAELSCTDADALQKIMSCKTYNKAFTKLLKYTPHEKEVTMDHIHSAITLYYSKFGFANAPFDQAMNKQAIPDSSVIKGFNLFMSKAQCGTCHFVPLFNGVKPPYVGSEFEVLGVPLDTAYTKLSTDKGRYEVNPATETLNAFRTGTVRNSMHTAPYMHNGVFKTMDDVIEFYNTGGGAGHGLTVANQTLSSDSLHLTPVEKEHLIHFIQSLTEQISFENAPEALPVSSHKSLNSRKVGGVY
jgi:cytochrome c peroxidase